MTRSKSTLFATFVLLVLGIVLAACDGGGGGGGQQTSPSATSSQQAPSQQTSSEQASSRTTSTEASTQATGGSVAGIPYYQPSTLINESTGSTVLVTRDPISKVSAFYAAVVEQGGWNVISKTITSAGSSFTIKKSGTGASIAVGPGMAGWTTGIAISTYSSP